MDAWNRIAAGIGGSGMNRSQARRPSKARMHIDIDDELIARIDREAVVGALDHQARAELIRSSRDLPVEVEHWPVGR